MDQRVEKAFDYIKQHYEKRINLEMIAEFVHVSPFHLQRLFKQQMGESPHECLNRIRLEKAAHLIKINPQKSMTEISLECGFSSLSTFSRAFKKAFELSPSEFKESPAAPLVSLEEMESLPALRVNVEYVPEYCIYYRHTSIYTPDLTDQFEIAHNFCRANGILHAHPKRLGVFSHIPFHEKHEHLNYLAGIQVKSNAQLRFSNIYQIPAGSYACFHTSTPYEQLMPLLVKFKIEWLDKKPYYIKTIFTFEEILEHSQRGGLRKVYIPIEPR